MTNDYPWEDVPAGFGDAYGDPGPAAEWSPAILGHMAEAGIDPLAPDARTRLEAHFADQNKQISLITNVAKVRVAAAMRHTEGLLDAVQHWREHTSEQRLDVLDRFSAAICHEWGFGGVPVDDRVLSYVSPTQGQLYATDEDSGGMGVAVNPLHTQTAGEIVAREVDEEQQQLAAEDGREGIQLGPGMQPFEMIEPERRTQEMQPGVDYYTETVRKAVADHLGHGNADDGQTALWIIGHEVAGHVVQTILPLVADYVPAEQRHHYDTATRILDWQRYIGSHEDHSLYEAQPIEAMATNVADFVVAQAQRLIGEQQQSNSGAGPDTVPPGDNSETGS